MIDPEVTTKVDYISEIHKLKKELNAVILAHYYQTGDIQDIADFVGDSLELAKKAKSTKADVIVFAGVHFMAETAKILNPDKLVLLPDLEASCSLAEGCPADEFKLFRESHPNHLAITYINCTAEVKALSDIICTSSSAEKIINQIPKDKPILFSPDKNLGKYLIRKTGRDMLLWEGSCIVHEHFNEKKIIDLMNQHPDAKLISHPECEEPILMFSNFIGSTSKLLNYVRDDSAKKYIVATETGIIHQMKKVAPEKEFIPAPPDDETCSCNDCPYMKLNTIKKLYLCMKNKFPEIVINEELRKNALTPIERMIEMS